MTTASSVILQLKSMENKDRAEHSRRFFKTGPGEYGEGDRFLGIGVPEIRKQVETFRDISMSVMEILLQSEWHEVRLFALLAMVDAFKHGSERSRNDIYTLYMNSADAVNNWDLVDTSAPNIAGAYLWKRNRQPLYDFAVSDSLWKRRIAIIATQHFIRKNSFDDTLRIAVLLLSDSEDLIHKAVGWMLREVGKKDLTAEQDFLNSRYTKMPRTTLRYAIEKFSPEKRRMYLKGLI